jgi:hypothetical protein
MPRSQSISRQTYCRGLDRPFERGAVPLESTTLPASSLYHMLNSAAELVRSFRL